jgi:hypothetical protein
MRGSIKALVVCGALMGAGLGAAGPAAASTAVPACSVTWVGNSEAWNNPANWSTGQVPGPTSDVCISGDGPAPEAGGPIDIHSLQVSDGAEPLFENLTISDILTDATGAVFFDGTLSAPTIDNAGLIQAVGASTITSPALSNTGIIQALDGSAADPSTLRLTDNPLQLANGTLNGGTLDAEGTDTEGTDTAIIINGDISSIAAGTIEADGGGSIENQSGGNALASVSSIGQNGTLAYGGTLTGNLVNQGYFGSDNADVTGDYTQTSTGTVGAGFIAGLTIGGTATLSGTLAIGYDMFCTPNKGTTKTVITFAARNGTFTTTPSVFNVTYGATSIQEQYEGPKNHDEC